MRIVAIVGSNRRGNTYAMVEAACHALNDSEVELIHLKDLDIKPCDGCLTCDESGACHLKDDMDKIIPRMKIADGFIFGTPARWGLLAGELKVFFDRLNPLALPQALKGKKAIIFAVGQTEGDEATSIENTVKSIKYFCENAGIEVIDTLSAYGCLTPNDLITKKPEILSKCKSSAKKLFKSLN
jgi:multimeric flavodoxin WrbA